jgi:hypothetical protein
MQITRTASIATSILMLGVVAGCGDSGSATSGATVTTPTLSPAATPTGVRPATTPTPPPAASMVGLTAKQLVTAAQTAAKAANSVRVKGTMTEGGERLRLDLRLARAGGQGTITVDGAAISVIVIGRTAYLRISDAFWRKHSESKADADAVIALVDGRWIKTALSSKDLGELAAFASKTGFFDELFEEPGALRKTATRTVDGIACIGLKNSDGTLWVDASNARPVRLEAPTKSSADVMTFSEYNQVQPPKAPPAAQVIDGKALGM